MKKFHSLNPVRAKKLERIPSSQLFRFLLPPYKGDSSSINMELYAIFFTLMSTLEDRSGFLVDRVIYECKKTKKQKNDRLSN